jgi:hypothetical protein
LQKIDDPSAETVRVPLANVNIEAANLTADDKKVSMASKLITVGFDPAQVLSALGLAPMAHTGVPSVQLQNLAQLDPNDPKAAYEA